MPNVLFVRKHGGQRSIRSIARSVDRVDRFGRFGNFADFSTFSTCRGARDLSGVKVSGLYDAWRPKKCRKTETRIFHFFGSVGSVFRSVRSILRPRAMVDRPDEGNHPIPIENHRFWCWELQLIPANPDRKPLIRFGPNMNTAAVGRFDRSRGRSIESIGSVDSVILRIFNCFAMSGSSRSVLCQSLSSVRRFETEKMPKN